MIGALLLALAAAFHFWPAAYRQLAAGEDPLDAATWAARGRQAARIIAGFAVLCLVGGAVFALL